MNEPRCTVSILSWPPGMDRAAAAKVLVQALGMDPYQADQRVAKDPPMVVARAPAAVAKSVRDVLRRSAVQALILADDDVARLPAPILAEHLVPAAGAPEPMYMVQPWRGETVGLRMREVYCLVRGRVRQLRVGPARMDPPSHHAGYGLAAGLHNLDTEVSITRERSAHVGDVIDLWLRDENATGLPRRIRINADKFNWDVLGDQRARTHAESADKLALLLASQAPSAAVELGFTAFCDASGPVLGLASRTSPSGTTRLDESPVFEFYSAWCALKHWKRAVAGRAADENPGG